MVVSRICSAILEVCALFFVGLKCSLILVLKVLPVWPVYSNHRHSTDTNFLNRRGFIQFIIDKELFKGVISVESRRYFMLFEGVSG
jgi:hypothetical protein